MSDTIQDLYGSFATQMEPIQEDDRYFRYLFEMAQASDTTIEQQREELVKVVDEEWISVIEDSLDAINTIIEKPRRFITTEEEVVPVSLAKKISADSVRHLSQNTQFLAPSDDGSIHPTKILNVNMAETYDLYENRFVYHLIQRLLTFVDKRTDVIFWSTGNEVRNRFTMHSKIGDAYEEIEYNVEMTVKDRQNFAENDADNIDTFMRIDRVRRLVMALRNASFCQIMQGCATVRSPIQRTNLIMKDPNYRKCYQLWQFMERYDKVGYNIEVKDSALAFDDEYMVQMYTNLINNYTVFKSLTTDDRNFTELASQQREPVQPKFIKEIKEEFVDSCDIPDVEVRKVFVDEVTQVQLDAEAAKARAETDAEVQRMQAEMAAEVQAALDNASATVSAAKEEAQASVEAAKAEAQAAKEDARARIEAAAADADALLKAARVDAAEKVEAARADAESKVQAANEHAKAQVAAAKAEAEARLAAVQSSNEEARKNHEAEEAQLRAQMDAAARAHEQAQKEHAAELAQLKQEMQQRIDQLSRSLEEAQNARIRAEKRAEGNKLSQYLLARLRGQEVSSAGGSEPGSKEQDSADEPSEDAK